MGATGATGGFGVGSGTDGLDEMRDMGKRDYLYCIFGIKIGEWECVIFGNYAIKNYRNG